MAATVTVLDTINHHNGAIVIANFQFDSAYVTGGEPYTPSDFGLSGVKTISVLDADDASQRAFADTTAKTIKLYVEDGTSGIEAEEGSTDDASAVNVRLLVTGVI